MGRTGYAGHIQEAGLLSSSIKRKNIDSVFFILKFLNEVLAWTKVIFFGEKQLLNYTILRGGLLFFA